MLCQCSPVGINWSATSRQGLLMGSDVHCFFWWYTVLRLVLKPPAGLCCSIDLHEYSLNTAGLR